MINETSPRKNTQKQHKRVAPAVTESIVIPPKKARTVDLSPCLAPHILSDIRNGHAQGDFEALENDQVRIYSSWKNYAIYEFVKLSEHDKQFLTDFLDDLIRPTTTIQTVQLLAAISRHKQGEGGSEPSLAALVPSFGTGQNVNGQDDWGQLLEAARKAHDYVRGFETAPYEARLRLLLAFITLHLTLEYAITARVRVDHGEWNKTQVKIEKWRIFDLEMGLRESQAYERQKLRDDVKFGKLLWSWTEACGIVWLPVFATMNRGIKSFLRQCPKKRKRHLIVGSQLPTNDSWVALSQAFAGLSASVLFTSNTPIFTVDELFRLYIAQPSGATSASRFQEAIASAGYTPIVYSIDIVDPKGLHLEDAMTGSLLDKVGIEIPEFPGSLVTLQKSRTVNLVDWVLDAKVVEMIELRDNRNQEGNNPVVLVGDLASLFGTPTICEPVFSFLARLWDAGGINGWCCLSLVEAEMFLQLSTADSIHVALMHTLESAASCTNISFILLPIETSTTYFLAVCNINTCTLTLFYLEGTENQDMELKATLNVSTRNCLQKPRLIVRKDLQRFALFAGWDIGSERIGISGNEMPGLKRVAGLIILALIHYMMRRSYLGEQPLGCEDPISLDHLVIGCLKAIYAEDLNPNENVLPLAILNM